MDRIKESGQLKFGQFVFDHFGVVFVFEGVYFGCDVGRGVGRKDRDLVLGDDIAAVVLSVEVVDGDSRFVLSGGYDRFMDPFAIHAFAAILGKQGGVYVDDTSGVGLDQVVGDEHQESCQHNIVDLFGLEQVEDLFGVEKCIAVKNNTFDTESVGTIQYAGTDMFDKMSLTVPFELFEK